MDKRATLKQQRGKAAAQKRYQMLERRVRQHEQGIGRYRSPKEDTSGRIEWYKDRIKKIRLEMRNLKTLWGLQPGPAGRPKKK